MLFNLNAWTSIQEGIESQTLSSSSRFGAILSPSLFVRVACEP